MSTPIPSFASFLSKPEDVGKPKSVLLYGRPGTRKTSLAAELITLPTVNKILFVDIDNGTEALLNNPEVYAAVESGDIQVLNIDSHDPEAFGKISKVIQEVASNDFGYDAIVLDTLNIIQDIAIKHFMANTFNSSGKLDSRAAWGEVSKWTDWAARSLHNAPHTTGIFILHEKSDTEDTGRVSIVPKLAGSAKDSIASVPSTVIHLAFDKDEDDETHLVANLGDNDIYVSKSRYSRFHESNIRDFTLVDFYKAIGFGGPSAIAA